MYSLIDFFQSATQTVHESVRQGSATAICFARKADRMAFVDRIFSSPAGGGRHRIELHIAPVRIGLVSHQPTLLHSLSVMENLSLLQEQLTGKGRKTFARQVDDALAETGLLPDVDLDATIGSLSWGDQVEVNFLQMWMREPEWLVFDDLFQDEESEPLRRLPALFRRRFPLRAISFLGQKGHMPHDLETDMTIELS